MKELMRNIQNHEPLWPSIKGFVQRYPWTVAFLLLLVAMFVGFLRIEQLDNEREADQVVRRIDNLKRDKDFCRAIPNSTVAGAQALVNILEAQAIREGDPKSDIDQLKSLGRLYTAEARRLALKELPECPRILVIRPADLK